MLHCWNEDPLQRPTFSDLHEHLDSIMTQSANYLSFDIDEENTYYNVASFKSVPSDDEEDDVGIFDDNQNAPKIKSVQELKEERNSHGNSEKPKLDSTTVSLNALEKKLESQLSVDDENERYVTPQTLTIGKLPENDVSHAYVNTAISTKDLSDLTM